MIRGFIAHIVGLEMNISPPRTRTSKEVEMKYLYAIFSCYIGFIILLTSCNQPEASAIIGPAGGIVEVTNASSPLYGVKVVVPAGALDNDTTITITQSVIEPAIPDTAAKVSKIVSLNPDGIIFNTPVSVTIPYNDTGVADENKLQIYSYNGYSWEGVTFNNRDTAKKILTAQTRHFSYHVVLEPKYLQKLEEFVPAIDGFPSKNIGDCFGMVSYAKWYFENKKSKYGALINKYDYKTAIQVAYDAQMMLANLNNVATHFAGLQTDQQAAMQIKDNLETTGRPQILLMTRQGSIGYHSVLVYKYSYDEKKFYFYDPDIPYEPKWITFDGDNFEHYGVYDRYTAVNGNLYNPKAMDTVVYPGTWSLVAEGVSQGCTEHTPCQVHPPYLCGTALCGSFNMGYQDIQVSQAVNKLLSSEVDANGQPFTLVGSINDVNSISFTIQGTGITPGIGPATTTYSGKKNGNTISGTFTGSASWTSEASKGNTVTETATWSGTFIVTVN